MENAATSAATPMMTPVVESVVRMGLVRNESAPTRADSMSAAEFTLKRFTSTLASDPVDDQPGCARKREGVPIAVLERVQVTNRIADRLSALRCSPGSSRESSYRRSSVS
jgi:hypothetical protein